MLTRTTHLIYIAAIVLLVAALLRPSLQGTTKPNDATAKDVARNSQTSNDQPSRINSAADDNELLQLAMLDSPDMTDKVRGSAAPQIFDVPSNRATGKSGTSAGQILKPEMIDQCLMVAGEIDPDFGDRLRKVRTKDPASFQRIIQQRGGRLIAMAQLKQSEPELYKIKVSELSQTVQVNRVAAQLRHAMQTGANPGQIEVLKNQLRTLLQMQLAMSIKSRGEYLCTLEDLIQKVRSEINSEAKHFPETIDGRMQHYMRQADDESAPASDGSTSDASSADEEPAH